MKALQAGISKVNELEEPTCLAVVDAGGNLVAFLRSENATFGTAEIAINKAYTASAFRLDTAELGPVVQPGAEIFGLLGQARPFIPFGGGLPVFRDGQHVGAVGASGGPVSADVAIAKAMVASLDSRD